MNLQRPTRRGALGIETVDWQLDLWIEPDGTVSWKDEDHLEQALALGLAAEIDARQAREEAHRVLDEWPFPTGWEEWEPPSSWTTPRLPADWATI